MTNKWDLRYLDMARLVSTWSKDPSTQTGAVIVRPNGTVASVGFNGFPKGMSDAPELYANREEKYSRVVRCEVNALIFSNGPVVGSTLYTWPFISCDRCMVQMLQAGIKRFVAPASSLDGLSRWGAAFEKVKKYAAEVGVEVVEVSREELGLQP
jgi:dCMP deaminase